MGGGHQIFHNLLCLRKQLSGDLDSQYYESDLGSMINL